MTTDESAEVRDFAALWQAADKVVYSRTLDAVWTKRTRLEREFDPDEVRRMKVAAARDLTVSGPELARHAFAAGLIAAPTVPDADHRRRWERGTARRLATPVLARRRAAIRQRDGVSPLLLPGERAGGRRRHARPTIRVGVSVRTPSASTRSQPSIARPRITKRCACGRRTRASVSSGSTRTSKPPCPLALTAMFPWTRNASPPNMRCSVRPRSGPTISRSRFARSSSYATAAM